MPAKLGDDGGDDRQTVSGPFGDTDGVITSSKGHLVAGLPCPRHCEAGRLRSLTAIDIPVRSTNPSLECHHAHGPRAEAGRGFADA
jgi:hypothetical protein